MDLLERLFTHIFGSGFTVENVYRWRTKAEILGILREHNATDLIPSAVTCSRTSMIKGEFTHCGQCFQCVDRRFAAAAAGLSLYDHTGLYASDFVREPIKDGEAKTAIIDYARLGIEFAQHTPDGFHYRWLTEIGEVLEHSQDQQNTFEQLFELTKRFGLQTKEALKAFSLADDLNEELVKGSLPDLIHRRDYLKEERERFALEVVANLQRAIPLAYASNPAKDERDVNDKINAMLIAESESYRREFPATKFALASVIPDHKIYNTLIETKYLRKDTTPSKARDGILADIGSYPKDAYLLFVVYDPNRSIVDDYQFRHDIESLRQCTVAIIR
jgi:hypothetical protein